MCLLFGLSQTLLPLSPLFTLLVSARRLPFVLEKGQPSGLDWPELQSCQPLPYWLAASRMQVPSLVPKLMTSPGRLAAFRGQSWCCGCIWPAGGSQGAEQSTWVLLPSRAWRCPAAFLNCTLREPSNSRYAVARGLLVLVPKDKPGPLGHWPFLRTELR